MVYSRKQTLYKNQDIINKIIMHGDVQYLPYPEDYCSFCLEHDKETHSHIIEGIDNLKGFQSL